jgi:hypothetical protein
MLDLVQRIHADLGLRVHLLGGELEFAMSDADDRRDLPGEVLDHEGVGRTPAVAILMTRSSFVGRGRL